MPSPVLTRPYHHGALRPALLAAAARALERDGLDGLSLRAIAREAGVSHAAPTHHFGDLRGLLTALATTGFDRFTASLEAASSGGLRMLGRAYVRFAQEQPGLFLLMFRSPVLDLADDALRPAMAAAFAALRRASDADAPAGEPTPPLANWCLVHGFCMLLLDGRLPSEPGVDALLTDVLGG